jgi:hypothetical protein
MINKEVHQYLFNLYENAAEAEHSFVMERPERKRKAVKFSLEKPKVHKIDRN